MIIKLQPEQHLEFLSLKGGCRGKLLEISCRGSNDFVFRSLDWEILPEEEGEEYTYTVQVTKQPSPKKRPMSPLKATMQERVTKETALRPPCTPPRKEVIEVTSSEDVGSSTDTTSPHEQFAQGR